MRESARRGIGPAVVPGGAQARVEQVEAAPGDLAHQRLAIAEMAIGRGRRHAHEPGGLREAEPLRAALLDQVARRLDQRVLEATVVIAARRAPPASPVRPAAAHTRAPQNFSSPHLSSLAAGETALASAQGHAACDSLLAAAILKVNILFHSAADRRSIPARPPIKGANDDRKPGSGIRWNRRLPALHRSDRAGRVLTRPSRCPARS